MECKWPVLPFRLAKTRTTQQGALEHGIGRVSVYAFTCIGDCPVKKTISNTASEEVYGNGNAGDRYCISGILACRGWMDAPALPNQHLRISLRIHLHWRLPCFRVVSNTASEEVHGPGFAPDTGVTIT